MPSTLSYMDLQHILLVKICFFVFVLFGLIGIYRKWKPAFFLFLAGGVSAVAYLFLVDDLLLSFWGLKADEITIAAMYEVFAHGSLFSDFAYADLPPFYPPLFFWVFGLIGRIFDWNGVQIAKFAAATTMACFPIGFYWLQKYIWRKESPVNELPGRAAWFLSALFAVLFVDWDAIITKPYELVSAALVVLWTTVLVVRIKQGGLSKHSMMLFGITGGILFMLFYFWFFLAAIGVALFLLFEKKNTPLKTYGGLLLLGGLILLVGSPFWVPLARSYAAYGSENWQLGFFVVDWIGTHGPLLTFSVKGILLFSGLVSLIAFRRIPYVRGLLSLFAASYVWQLMGIMTILFFASPLQESKGFLFFQTAILALAAAFGAERLLVFIQKRWPRFDTKTASMIGLLVLAPMLFFGTFTDAPDVQAVRDRAAAPRLGIMELAAFLNEIDDIHGRVVLSTGIPELSAFVPLNHFLYFNQHNSHPAAGFSERLHLLGEAVEAADIDAFYDTIQRADPAIDLFVFYKGEVTPGMYTLYVHTDAFPHLFREETVDVPRVFFEGSHVNQIYENGQYIVYEMNEL